MRFRVRVRVRGLVFGPYGPWGQCALRGAQGPDVKNMRFIVPGMRFRVRVRVRGLVCPWVPGPGHLGPRPWAP